MNVSTLFRTTLAASAFLFSTSVTAQAVNLEANTNYYENGTLVHSESGVDASFATASSFGSNGSSNAWSRSDGTLGASASAGRDNNNVPTSLPMASAFSFNPAGAVSAQGTAIWESTITNNQTTSLDYTFGFHVVNPNFGTTGANGDLAGIAIDILLNGTSVWAASAFLQGAALSYDAAFGAPIYQSGNSYSFGSFDAFASLGSFAAGESFTLSYHLTAYADAAVRDVSGVWAGVGDPFNLNGVQILTSPTVSAIPEPATWAMMIAGFGMVGAAIRRRQSLTTATA